MQVGELGSNSQGQHGDLKLMKHKRSKEIVAVKMVKRGAGRLPAPAALAAGIACLGHRDYSRLCLANA